MQEPKNKNVSTTIRHEWTPSTSPKHSSQKCLFNPIQESIFSKKIILARADIPITRKVLRRFVSRCFSRGRLPSKFGSCKIFWKNPGYPEKNLVFSKTWSNCPKTLTIDVYPRYLRTHRECFIIEKKTSFQLNNVSDPTCQCCQIPTSAIPSIAFNTRKVFAPVIIQMESFFNERFREWTLSQSRLVQYILIEKNNTITYMDLFDRLSDIKQFDSLQEALKYSKHRFGKRGNKLKGDLLKRAKKKLEPYSSYESGVFNSWITRLKKVESEMVIFLQHYDGHNSDFESEAIKIQSLWNSFKLIGQPKNGKRYGFIGSDVKIVLSHILIGTVKTILDFYDKVREYFQFMDFYLDTETISNKSISQSTITFESILNKIARNPLFIGLETPSFGMTKLLTKYNMHQLLFCNLPFAKKGETMAPDKSEILGYLEMDMSMAYSHNLAMEKMPIGMPQIFSSSGGKSTLVRSGRKPFSYGEFNLVYYIINQMTKNPDIEIKKVYHRYSPNGNLHVGKYSLDLLIVYEEHLVNGIKYAAYQFHHAYTHTCPKCKYLKRYTKGLSRDVLEKQSNSIDDFWRVFCKRRLGSELMIIWHCHEMHIFNRYFENIGELARSCNFLSHLKNFPFGEKLTWPQLLSELDNPDLCIYVIGEGAQTNIEREASICTRSEQGHTVISNRTLSPTMFYGPYLSFLMNNIGFAFTSIYHVFVYKSTDLYKPLFQQLVKMRINHPNNYFAEQLKLSCNSFVGYSGSISKNSPTIKYFSGKLTHLSRQANYNFLSPHSYSFESNNELYPKSNLYLINMTVLQLYRMKMIKTMELMSRVFQPRLFRIVQCHVDSFFIVLGRANIEDCVACEELYKKHWKNEVLSEEKVPGKFKEVRKSKENDFFNFFIPGITQIKISEDESNILLPNNKRRNFIAKYTNNKMKFVGFYGNNLPYFTTL